MSKPSSIKGVRSARRLATTPSSVGTDTLRELPLVRAADLPDFLAARVNFSATSARLKPSGRILLLGLVDKLRSSPGLASGSLHVSLSGKDAESLLDLSSSSCTNARVALVEAGLVLRVGDALDLVPWVAGLARVQFSPVPQGGSGEGPGPLPASSFLPESGSDLLRNVNNTLLGKNSQKVGSLADRKISQKPEQLLLSLGDLHEAVLLSEALTAAVRLQTGLAVEKLSERQLLDAMTLCVETVLVGQSNAVELWRRALARHGASAILGLVVAVEDPTVRLRGRWFAAFASGGGAFAADIVDVRPNLASLRAARVASVAATVAVEAIRTRHDTTVAFVEEAQAALSDLEENCASPAEYQSIRICDRYVKVFVDAAGGRYLFNTAGYGNPAGASIQKLLDRLAHVLKVPSHDIRTGDRPHAMSLG